MVTASEVPPEESEFLRILKLPEVKISAPLISPTFIFPIKKNHTVINLVTEVATRFVGAYQSITLYLLYLRIF